MRKAVLDNNNNNRSDFDQYTFEGSWKIQIKTFVRVWILKDKNRQLCSIRRSRLIDYGSVT